jgi:predicted NUDIX family NTP pyrophosphohydrolase
MAKLSAGILLYRGDGADREVLLVHPGGPFWARKDKGAWSIPKGEYGEGEDALSVAKREFEEELGSPPPRGKFVPLGELVQPSRKRITAFAAAGDFDPKTLKSNLFELEWPRGSGRRRSFPEVDRAAWFALAEAREKIRPGQAPFLQSLEALLGR